MSAFNEYIERLRLNDSSLTSLNLGINNIGYERAKEIADALKVNSSLIFLNLGWNKIGEEGAKEIAEALKVNSSLTYLDIVWNNIGDKGTKEIVEALKANSSLTKLIGFNKKEIEKILERNKENKKRKDISLFELLLPQID